jgi:hypothetical protein
MTLLRNYLLIVNNQMHRQIPVTGHTELTLSEAGDTRQARTGRRKFSEADAAARCGGSTRKVWNLYSMQPERQEHIGASSPAGKLRPEDKG